MPSLTSTGGRLVRINPGSTALEAMTLTPGAVLYGGGNNEVVQGNNFVWNASNNGLEVSGSFVANGPIVSNHAVRALGTSTLGVNNSVSMEWLDPVGRIVASGNSNANRAGFIVSLRTGDGGNTLSALSIDSNGNASLNNLNATEVGLTNLNATGTLRAAGNASLNNLNATEAGVTNLNATGAISATGNVSAGNVNVVGALRGTSAMLSPLNNFLTADVNLSNPAAFFDGPSIAQGNSGTWFVSGTVSLQDTLNNNVYVVKLHDGTNIIGATTVQGTLTPSIDTSASLSGFIANPVGNLRISVRETSSATGKIHANPSSLGNVGSFISAIRIG
jgi:hypothetical protein